MYIMKTVEMIWEFPNQIKTDINSGLERLKNGEKGPIKIKTTLVLEIDEKVSRLFNEEISKLSRLH
jgi:hypothetical protein